MHKRFIKHSYTLVELLVVLAIVGVLLGIGMPAFQKIAVGNKVDTTARNLGGVLSLARSQAIVKNCYMAVLIPDEKYPDSNFQNTSYACKKFRICKVEYDSSSSTTPYKFKSWYKGAGWKEAEVGTAVYIADPQNSSSSDCVKTVEIDSTNYTAVNAIIFKPYGGVALNDFEIKVVQGEYSSGASANSDADNHKIVLTNTDNSKTIKVNMFTGKISYE